MGIYGSNSELYRNILGRESIMPKKPGGRRPETRFWLWSEHWLLGSTRTELSNEERAVFVDFLCLAALKGGYIECYSRDQLASQLCISKELFDRSIKKFIKTGKIERNYKKREKKEVFCIRKWEQYQPEYLWKKPNKSTRKARSTIQSKNDAYVVPIREEKRKKEKKEENILVKSPKKFSDIDIHLTNLLIEKILENNPKSRVQRISQKIKEDWYNECKRLREIDNRTPEEIETVIYWSQEDDFEKTVVLSMPKLRERFDSLWLKYERTKAKTEPKSLTTEEKNWVDGKGRYKDE